MKGTVNIHIARLWPIMAALIMLTLGSCRNDSDSRDPEANRVTLYPAVSRNMENVILTRSVNVEEHWTDDNDIPQTSTSVYPDLEVNGTSMMVYAVPADNTLSAADRGSYKSAGSFRYSNGTWHSSVAATNGQPYYLFATSPINLPGATSQSFNWGETDGVFNPDNAVLTFNGLDVITTSDPMVSIAAAGKHVITESGVLNEIVTEKNGDTPAVTQALQEPTLVKGIYNIGTVYDDGTTGDDSYRIWMAMDRLYAKATISFAIDAEYNDLRTIRIRSLKITTKYNGVAQQAHLDGTHSYRFAPEGEFMQGGRLTLSNEGFSAKELSIDLMDVSNPMVLDNRDLIDPQNATAGRRDYATLKVPKQGSGDYWEFASFFFLPQASLPSGFTFPMLYLDVTYDVYSKAGTKTRSDHVINAISLSSIYLDTNVDYAPAAGDNIKIKIMVKPTYIYQLSDDDVEFDIKIE